MSSTRIVHPFLQPARRNISFLKNPTIGLANAQLQDDFQHAVHMVKTYDPAGNLPGRLLPTSDMSVTYYSTRSFWVETGLRFGSTAKVPPNASPQDHLEWWQEGINHVYNDNADLPQDWNHPTLRLLQEIVKKHNLSKCHFDDILTGRRRDLDLKQYPTLDSLTEHVILSCGSLSELVLESGHVTFSKALDAAKLVGVCHGLSNALRTSIPVISTTGKLVIPQDLCVKYGVKSPRYLLSSLGLGDAECRAALYNAVRDIAHVARSNLEEARGLRDTLLANEDGDKAVAVLIPGLASETFLDRLEKAGYDLTDRNLRNVGFMEHAVCASRMIAAYYQKRY
jgi:phytoene/squalene synthetase